MNKNYTKKTINELFDVVSGNFHAVKDLGAGSIPLVACGDANNGVIGYFDIPSDKTYSHALTVAYNGTYPIMSKFHPYKFGAKDDVAVLIPRFEMKEMTLIYIATVFNTMTWRYTYHRKCYREKLQNTSILVPTIDSTEYIDEEYIASICSRDYKSFLPQKGLGIDIGKSFSYYTNWKSFNIRKVFDIYRGDFHSITELDSGDYMTISRTSTDNGVAGYFDLPDSATVYPPGLITISTVGGDAFVQMNDFIATDNVIICIPKKPTHITTMFFVSFILNQHKWRYLYGRQCYINKLAKMSFELPVTEADDIDEDYIRRIVKSTSYWSHIERRFPETDYIVLPSSDIKEANSEMAISETEILISRSTSEDEQVITQNSLDI